MKLPFLSFIACVSSTQIACDEKNKCHPKADCYQEKNKQENVQILKQKIFMVNSLRFLASIVEKASKKSQWLRAQI